MAEPATAQTPTVELDFTDDFALLGSLRELDLETRRRLAEALDDIKVGETHAAIVAEVATIMSALYPERPVRGVVFCYTDDDPTVWRLSSTHGDVLFADGGTEDNASFEDARSYFLYDLLMAASERLGGSPTFAVDLREGTVDDGDTQYGIHAAFGESQPE